MIECCKTHSETPPHAHTIWNISDILDYLYNRSFLLIKETEMTRTLYGDLTVFLVYDFHSFIHLFIYSANSYWTPIMYQILC